MSVQMTLRHVDFVGETDYPQGYGMRWDNLGIELDLGDDEEIVQIAAMHTGGGFNSERAMVRVWIAKRSPA